MQKETQHRIGGIKFTENLALVSITVLISETETAMRFFSLMAANEINIVMITQSLNDQHVRTDCAIAEDHIQRIMELTASSAELQERMQIQRGLGAISIYPHKSRTKLLGIILTAFGANQIPVYGMASSLSAFTFLTQCDCLNLAVEALEVHFTLPPNHAPFEKQFCIKHVHK